MFIFPKPSVLKIIDNKNIIQKYWPLEGLIGRAGQAKVGFGGLDKRGMTKGGGGEGERLNDEGTTY